MVTKYYPLDDKMSDQSLVCSCLLYLQETEVLQQCDELLKKLGMKGSIFGSNPPPQVQQQQPDSSGKAGDG